MKTFLTVTALLGVAVVSKASFAEADAAKYAGLAYSGKPQALPGVVQAEEYDIAPDASSGVTFGYNRPGNKNDVRKTPDAIGMARCGKGHVSIKGEPISAEGAYLGWTQDGQWTKYSVHVEEAGTYAVGGQFAAAGKGAKLSFTFTPSSTDAPAINTGPVEVPTTAGYQPDVEVYHVWEKLEDMAQLSLPKGDYLLTVKIEKNAGLNLDYFSFTKKP